MIDGENAIEERRSPGLRGVVREFIITLRRPGDLRSAFFKGAPLTLEELR